MDPASIIGLTVAIVEGLWKVGNGTADFISKYREFDNVSTTHIACLFHY